MPTSVLSAFHWRSDSSVQSTQHSARHTTDSRHTCPPSLSLHPTPAATPGPPSPPFKSGGGAVAQGGAELHSLRTRATDESGLREVRAHLRVPGLPGNRRLLQRKHTARSGGADLGCPWAGWFISSVTAIRSLCNHIQVQITGLVSEPINPEPGLSSWQASLISQAAGASRISAHVVCSSMSAHPQMNKLAELCQTA